VTDTTSDHDTNAKLPESARAVNAESASGIRTVTEVEKGTAMEAIDHDGSTETDTHARLLATRKIA
jgi:hypothetical protein